MYQIHAILVCLAVASVTTGDTTGPVCNKQGHSIEKSCTTRSVVRYSLTFCMLYFYEGISPKHENKIFKFVILSSDQNERHITEKVQKISIATYLAKIWSITLV